MTSAIIMISFFVVFFVLERVFRLRHFQPGLGKRLVVNLLFSLGVFAASSLLVKPAIMSAFQSDFDWSLLAALKLDSWAEALIAFLLLDLSFYYWHMANHRIPLLWRFHAVHHSDEHMDTSTAFRFHFVEVAYSSAFRFAQVLLIGMSFETFLLYELVFVTATVFHHSNVALPWRVEKALSVVLVTPRVHELHHSIRKHENFSNYGVVFSFWDRAHKSFSPYCKEQLKKMGIPHYLNDREQGLWALITAPFKKRPSFWTKSVVKKP